jgi:hypothetical protein
MFLLVAVYLLDDAVLHPEPGTTAANHVLSGALPVSALLWAAARHPVWRAPTRAAVSTAVGLLALGVGQQVHGDEQEHGSRQPGLRPPREASRR